MPPESSRGNLPPKPSRPTRFRRCDPGAVRLLALDLEGKADVGVEIAPGQKVRFLEDDANIGMRTGDRYAVEPDLAAGQAVQARHRPQERGLAAAGRADDRDDFIGSDIEAAAVQRQEVTGRRVIDLGRCLHAKLRRCCLARVHPPLGDCVMIR